MDIDFILNIINKMGSVETHTYVLNVGLRVN